MCLHGNSLVPQWTQRTTDVIAAVHDAALLLVATGYQCQRNNTIEQYTFLAKS